MTRSSVDLHLAPEFEDFLFAPVGEDEHGMLLSVLSALARLNIDPWREAAKLAGMPVKTATERLASLIAALPDGPPGTSPGRHPPSAAPDLPPRRGAQAAGMRGRRNRP